MKAAYKFPTLPAVALETNRSLKNMFVLSASLVLIISALWYLKSVVAAPTSAPYRASTLDLRLSGAISLSLSLTDWDGVESALSSEGFTLTFNDAPVAFELEFEGLADSETTIYDLSGGTYPLTLTLLNGGEGYHRFTATQGTVELGQDEGTVTAFLNDEQGQQLFVSLRFDWPEASQACSESYRFCFNAL